MQGLESTKRNTELMGVYHMFMLSLLEVQKEDPVVFFLSIRHFQALSLLKFEVHRRNKVPAPFQKDHVLAIVEKMASELLSIGKLVHFRYAKAH